MGTLLKYIDGEEVEIIETASKVDSNDCFIYLDDSIINWWAWVKRLIGIKSTSGTLSTRAKMEKVINDQ